MHRPRPRVAPWLFTAVLACFLLTYQSISSDGTLHYEAARHLVRTGVPALPAARFDPDVHRSLQLFARKGRDGQVFLTLAPGLSLLAAPFCLVGVMADRMSGITAEPPSLFEPGLTPAQAEPRARALARRPSVFITGLANPLCSALLVLVLFQFARDLSGSPRRAACLALVAGLATMLWPYAITFWTQPATALGLLGSLYMAWRHGRSGQPRAALAAGALAGLACAVRYDAALAVPWIAGLLLAMRWRQPERGARWRSLAWFLAPLAAVAALLAGWNFYRFGHPFDTGSYHQSLDRLLRVDGLGQHLLANLLSPNQGLLVFSPPLLLTLAGLRGLWRGQRALAAAIVGICGSQLVFHSAFIFWDTAQSWGPRFLVTLVPLALLPGAVLDMRPAWRRFSLRAVAVAGFLVQLPAVLLPLQLESILATMSFNSDSALALFLASEIPLQARMVLQGRIELWWLHGPALTAVGLALAAMAAVSAWKLARALATAPAS